MVITLDLWLTTSLLVYNLKKEQSTKIARISCHNNLLDQLNHYCGIRDKLTSPDLFELQYICRLLCRPWYDCDIARGTSNKRIIQNPSNNLLALKSPESLLYPCSLPWTLLPILSSPFSPDTSELFRKALNLLLNVTPQSACLLVYGGSLSLIIRSNSSRTIILVSPPYVWWTLLLLAKLDLSRHKNPLR